MKIVGIISSSQKHGHTAQLVSQAIMGAQSQNADVEELFLPDYNLKFCKGCMSCLKQGHCILNDDLEMLRDKLVEADGIIIGSPTHALASNARMKNFLDRIGLYAVYSGSLTGKYIVGISTAGSMGASRTAKELAKIGSSFFGRNYTSGILGVTVGWKTMEQCKDQMSKSYLLGVKITNDIKTKRRYPFQHSLDRCINYLVLRPRVIKNITSHRNEMEAVYQWHLKHGRIK